MQEFIINILRINIMAAFCILITAVTARFLGHKYSARWKCAIWLLLSIALLFPINLTGHTSLVQMEVPLPQLHGTAFSNWKNDDPETASAGSAVMNEGISAADGTDINGNTAYAHGTNIDGNTANADTASHIRSSKQTFAYQSAYSQQQSSQIFDSIKALDLDRIIVFIWLTGALLLFTFHAFNYANALRKLRRWSSPMLDEITLDLYRSRCKLLKVDKKPRLLKSSDLSTPLLAGFLDTCLYLPDQDYSPQELNFIFRHELCHYQRRDLWFKGLLFVVRSLYWFNPSLLYMQREAEKDLEFTCDEHVIRDFPQTSRLRYNELLLRTAAHSDKKLSRLTAGLNDSLSGFKERVHNVMDAGKRKKGRIPALFLVLIFLSSVLFIGCSLKTGDTSSENPSAAEQDRPDEASAASGSAKKENTISQDSSAEKEENLSETKNKPIKTALKTDISENQDSKDTDLNITNLKDTNPKNTEPESAAPENTEPEAELNPEEFVIFDSGTKVLTQQDTANLSTEELMYARNEIYARHGYIFTDPDIKSYFERKSWYKPKYTKEQFSDTLFNTTEVQNIQFLLSQENAGDGLALYQGDGYSFEYPADWQDKLVFEPTQVGVEGVLKEQYELRQSGQSERFGNLFTVFRRELPDDNLDFEYLGQGPDGMYYYFYITQGVTHEETPEMNDAYSRLDFSRERAQVIPDTFNFN